MEQKISEQLLYYMGKELLGTQADGVDKKVVQVAGLLGFMGKLYATEKGIQCDNVATDYSTLTVNFMKGKEVIDGFTITVDDIANPKEWHNRLLRECGKEIPDD